MSVIGVGISYSSSFSWNCHLTVVEGFGCPNDPRSYVVGVLFVPGRVTQGKLVLGEGPDKAWFEKFYDGEEQGLVYPAQRGTVPPWSQAWGRGP